MVNFDRSTATVSSQLLIVVWTYAGQEISQRILEVDYSLGLFGAVWGGAVRH